MFILFLTLTLLLSPFVSATEIYANEGDAAAQTEATSAAPENTEEPSTETPPATTELTDNTASAVLPAAPQNFAVDPSSITATSATLNWATHPDQSKIDIWYDGESGNHLAIGSNGSVTLENLAPNTTYKLYSTWYVRPYTSSRDFKSDYAEFTTLDGTATGQPIGNTKASNIQVVSATHNTATITFDPAHKLDNYWVWNPSNVPLGKDPYVFYTQDGGNTIEGLKENTTYTFILGPNQVQYAALTPEQKSETFTFTTTEDTSEYKEAPLTPPLNIRITEISNTGVTVKFTGSPDSGGYDFYVNGGYGGGIYDGSGRDTFTYNFPGGVAPAAGTSFSFMVGSQAVGKNPVNSAPLTIKWGQLAAPKDLQIITSSRTTATLGWAPTPGATSYDIYRDDTLIGTSDSNRFVVEGLTEGQTYSYTVSAKNVLWQSPQSAAATSTPGADFTNFTYYGSWMVYSREYLPTDVDFSQITHINYAFFDLCWRKAGSKGAACQNPEIPIMSDYVYDGEMILGDQEVDLNNLAMFKTIKENNPHLKVMASVGGWTYSNFFSNMAASEVTRRAFANSVVKYLREFKLDGLDIDWEYPIEGGEDDTNHSPDDTVNFTKLMKTVRETLDAAGSADGKYYLLTIASGQGDNFVVNADLKNSVHYLDMINIMSYDLSGHWEFFGYHNSPLYQDPNNTRRNAKRANVRGGLLGHLNGGVPPYKLNLGIPYYGKGWVGCDANGQYQACDPVTPPGTWEGDQGLFDFTDLQENKINKDGHVRYWNPYSKISYLYNQETGFFYTYNDETTMMYTSSLAKTLNLAGVMSWEISADRNKTLTTQLIKDLPIHGDYNENALKAPVANGVAEDHDSVLITWNAVEGASEYEVFADYIYLGTTTETKYSIGGLYAATDRVITVLSVRKDGDVITEVSPASNPVTVRTAALASPGDLKVSNIGIDQLSVKWNATPGATGYEVYLNNTLAGYTENLSYSWTGLSEGTRYTIKVVALQKNGATVVSTSSPALLDATTALLYVPPVYANPGQGQNELDSTYTNAGGKWAISILKDAALKTIAASKEDTFKVTVAKEALQTEVTIPKEVIAALASKGENAELAIIWNNVTYIVPVHALPKNGDIQITLAPPSSADAEALEKLAKDNGLTTLIKPLDFKISQRTADNKWEEVVDFDDNTLTRIFTLDGKNVDPSKATGVVYLPGSKEFRPVPTLFTKNADGTVTAELKRNGNSIYSIVQSNVTYIDVKAEWAKEAIARATAKLLLSDEADGTFGASNDISRAEFVSAIVKGLGILPLAGSAPFADVAAGSDFAGDIAAAKALGLIKGKSATSFDPNGTISRQDIAIVLTNVLAHLGEETDADSAALEAFADSNKIASYAKSAVALVVDQGIMNGKSGSKFDPKANVTKAQAAVILIRLLDAQKLD
ncbi:MULTISPECIES: glycosyl hydrolase family 18 protein [unclassified Paenibacillus]|uniref:glycosyl hydrolase family 18 protein n=1 Tax=unclassified Paenibacillus TaxID=185978 RepID=UPI0036D33289